MTAAGLLPDERERTGAAVGHPVLSGRHPVAALWFPAAWWNEAGRARRLLAHWVPGSRAWRFAQGDLLCWPQPVTHDCDALDGWPLRRWGDGTAGPLCSAAVSVTERAALPHADAWIVLAGQVLTLTLSQGEPLDPADWLALDDLPVLSPDDLGFEAAEPVLLTPTARSVREVVGEAVGPASAAQQAFAQAMARRGSAQGATAPAGSEGRGGADLRGWTRGVGVLLVLAVLASWAGPAWRVFDIDPALVLWLLVVGVALLGLLVWLARRSRAAVHRVVEGAASRLQSALREPAQEGAGAGAGQGQAGGREGRPASGGGGGQPSRALPARRRLVNAMPSRWREWLLRMAVSLPVGRWLGRQQADYLRRMLAMFDEGDLGQALRHALPLSDGEETSAGPAFGVPRPRDDLRLGDGGGAATSLGLGDDLREHLRQRYRRAFEQLAREKRIDEAVFVLAELLQARQEALDYLEQNDRLAQAAALALAWDQPPDVIVRLHALAGDWRMAVAVARRDRAFAGAVRQLAPRWPDAARRLREAWADTLVQQGDWLGAVDAVWPDELLRERAGAWLDSAQRAGGSLGVRALVKRAVLVPGSWRDDPVLLQSLRDDPAWHVQRAALAEALLAEGTQAKPALASLAALVVPAILADHARGERRFNQQMLQRLIALTGDACLQADLPRGTWPSAQPLALWRRSEPLVCEAPPAGALPVLDAVPLEAPHYLLALGEAGAQVVDDLGRVVTRFDRPAHRIVLSHNRRVALLLAPRGELWRVSRIDLVRRGVSDLGLCELAHFADTFDGIAWTVVRGGSVLVLDATKALNEVLWRIGDLPGPVSGLVAGSNQELLVVGEELWRYHLPGRRLGAREPLLPLAPGQVRVLHLAHGVIDVGRATGPQPGSVVLTWRWGASAESRLAWEEGEPLGLRVMASGHGLMLAGRDMERGSVVHWVQLGGRVDARIDWPGTYDPRIRGTGEGDAMFFDDLGRCLHVCAQTGVVVRFAVR